MEYRSCQKNKKRDKRISPFATSHDAAYPALPATPEVASQRPGIKWKATISHIMISAAE